MAARMFRMGRRVARGGVAAALAAATLAVAVPAQAAPRHKWHPTKPQRVRVLPRIPMRLPAHQFRLRHVPEGMRGGRSWPKAGTAAVTFAGTGRAALPRPGKLAVVAAQAGAG